MVLEKAPLLIQELGAATQQGLTPLAELGKGIGAGMGNIDKVNIIDMGGGKDGKDALTRYAMTVPDVLFTILARMKTVGIDVDGLLRKVGIDPSKVGDLVASAPEEPPAESSAPPAA